MPAPVIEVSGLSKDYHGLRPLRIEALTLHPGEHVAILGLDQPMAETLVNLVTGATLPEQGEVRILGRSTRDITDSGEWLAFIDQFGIVSPRAVLLEELSVLQNLAMPFTLEIDPPADDVAARAGELAYEVGLLETDLARPVAALDDEGKMRVRLARALALGPAILLLEHASAGLAIQDARRFGTTVREIATRRQMALLAASSGDREFTNAVTPRVLSHEAATGRLIDTRGGFFGRLLGR